VRPQISGPSLAVLARCTLWGTNANA